ncbi:conserved hypothetical protein [Beutenbergia cavernae DSM 12333]|uniref:Cardiolipin synthase N-terminal domain-containing protein n=1 Tax=Beutenbergia cavernae (strain ATCC BAA-8 / DSM 12333 / CCUG 43141 / JCM 11478 / NBRC 16432 / NCIMB 13614 / HKI 0122) TaxID=471853 RepID=C5BVL0_BEUC1|nr:PLD nuclease N-terminal domain-containing protein [Beutenbergia cavernae]ACQ78450.1 conserved hypothetical protein [Beutenbergia cavernae DSM 12333]
MAEQMKWQDLEPSRRAGVVTLAAVQIALAVAAWRDLARREAQDVRGPKPLWAAIIAVNWVGPASYFLVGRRRHA